MAKDSYLRKYRFKTGEISESVTGKIDIGEQAKQEFLEGKMLLIDKPLHWTSFDVVKKIRYLIGIKKIGHAGTLDPLATGLLIICTGKFTKKINELMISEKTYTGSITIGATTPTYDLESDPVNFKDYSFVTEELIRNTVLKFTGDIQQRPPVYSAIKKEGTRAYELARQGIEVEMELRKAVIYTFEIKEINLPVINFEIRCSTGTYIRSIANDFGEALGCGGYLSSLRRTAIGDYKVTDAITIDRFIEDIIRKGNLSQL